MLMSIVCHCGVWSPASALMTSCSSLDSCLMNDSLLNAGDVTALRSVFNAMWIELLPGIVPPLGVKIFIGRPGVFLGTFFDIFSIELKVKIV